MAEFARLKANLIQPVDDDGHCARQTRFYGDFPDHPNGGGISSPRMNITQQQGMRVLFTGLGGNQLLEGDALYLADLADGLELKKLLRCAPWPRGPQGGSGENCVPGGSRS